ncbi:hypothetical protein ABW54_24755 [Burkholderia cenocepacia]|nr:hypothetical protein ABW54_24755 [Burkholderia cenocepacia]
MGLFVETFEELLVMRIFFRKYVPNHGVTEFMSVLSEMRLPMVVRANSDNISFIVSPTAIQRNDMVRFQVVRATCRHKPPLAT